MNAHVERGRSVSPRERPHWMRHFARPEGVAGGLVGHLMAWKNARFNRAAVELLDPQPGEQVLEVGYGPGTAIPLIAARNRPGTVFGVDASTRMLQQASWRNRRLIEAGRVELYEASVADMPFDGASFDRVLVVNNFHIWPDRAAALQEIARVLKEGGKVLLAVRGRYTAPGLDEDQIERALQEIRAAGFDDVHAKRVSLGRELIAMIGRT